MYDKKKLETRRGTVDVNFLYGFKNSTTPSSKGGGVLSPKEGGSTTPRSRHDRRGTVTAQNLIKKFQNELTTDNIAAHSYFGAG